jgi:hypothetical protein
MERDRFAPSPSRGGLGWGWVGRHSGKHPIALPASPLKGEENVGAVTELVA